MGLVLRHRRAESLYEARMMVSDAESAALDHAEELCEHASQLMDESRREAAEVRRAATEAAEQIVEAAREQAADLLRRVLSNIQQTETRTELECQRLRQAAQDELNAGVAFRRQSMTLLREARRVAAAAMESPAPETVPIDIDLRETDHSPIAV